MGKKVLISIRECKTPKFSQGDYEASFCRGKNAHFDHEKQKRIRDLPVAKIGQVYSSIVQENTLETNQIKA